MTRLLRLFLMTKNNYYEKINLFSIAAYNYE